MVKQRFIIEMGDVMKERIRNNKFVTVIIVLAILNTFTSWFLFINLVLYQFSGLPAELEKIAEKEIAAEQNQPESDITIEYTPGKKYDGFSVLEVEKIKDVRSPFSTPPTVSAMYEQEEREYRENLEALQELLDKKKAEDEAYQNFDIKDGEKEAGREEKILGIPVYSNKGEYIETKESKSSGDENSYSKKEIEVVGSALTQETGRDIPLEWLVGIAEHTSNYQSNLKTTDGDGVIRRGLMQYQENAAIFVKEELSNSVHNSELDYNMTYNLDIAARYLSYLAEKKADPHFVFTTYWLGEEGAENVRNQNGSYRTDFSENIIELINSY